MIKKFLVEGVFSTISIVCEKVGLKKDELLKKHVMDSEGFQGLLSFIYCLTNNIKKL